MKLLIKRSRKFIVGILLFAMLIMANFGLLNSSISSVFAAEVDGFGGFSNEVEVKIDNDNFSTNSSTSNGYPYTPKNWTFKSGLTTDYIKHGLINLNTTTYKNNYEKYGMEKNENPGLLGVSSDNYALMINSREYSSSCGYVSNAFELSKNGIYHISVNVYTDDIEGSASLYLYNNEEVFAKITNINTGAKWSVPAYHFVVNTNDYENLSLTLGLWQGSEDVESQSLVIFDEVSAGQISKSTADALMDGLNLDGKTKTNAENVCFVNLDGENNLNAENLSIGNNSSLVEDKSAKYADSDYTTYFNNTAYNVDLEIENKKENYIAFESGEFELLSNKVYKFSIKAKTEDLTTGNAFFRAVEVADKDAKSSSDVKISSTKNVLDDNWSEYSIIIVSDPIKTRTIKFEYGLGTSETAAKGKVYFNGITARSVPYTEFSDPEDNYGTLDFSEAYAIEDSSNLVENFAFFKAEANEISKQNEVKIADPANWTVTTNDKNNQSAGVFNVKDFNILNKTNLPNIVNPGFISSINNQSNNVLMLNNKLDNYLVAKSKAFSLTKQTIYKVSVWVNTQLTGENGAAITVCDENNSSLVYGYLKNINTNGLWQEYEIYIKTAYEDLDVNLSLSLGTSTEKARGFAFFDNCFVVTSTEDAFNASKTKFDLTNALGFEDNNKPTYWTGSSNNNKNKTVSYLLNLEDLSSVLMKTEADDAKNSFVGENKNVLAIHSTNTDDYYTLTTKLNYKLESGSYYKFSVDVYTAYLATDVEKGIAGASIKLTNLEDGEFVNVASKLNAETSSKWTTYTFYVNPNSATSVSLVLGLGNADNYAHGTVLFGNLVFEKIEDKNTYLELAEADEFTKVLGTVTEEDDDAEKEESETDFNWQLIIYSLTAVAVIIAVLGVGFKKLIKPRKKRVRKSVVEYDRSSSMTRQKYRRLAYIKRDKDIRKLEKELSLLNADKQEKEQKYKELLSKVREVKINNRDGKLKAELALLNKNLTKASHSVAKIGVEVNKIKNEIALMKTEGYLKNLENKLVKQDELAKAKGLSIEAMILGESEEVEIQKDNSLDDAINKANEIIDNKDKLVEDSEKLEEKEITEPVEETVDEAEVVEEAEVVLEEPIAEVIEESINDNNVVNEETKTEVIEQEENKDLAENTENLAVEDKTEEVKEQVENLEKVAESVEKTENLDSSSNETDQDNN